MAPQRGQRSASRPKTRCRSAAQRSRRGRVSVSSRGRSLSDWDCTGGLICSRTTRWRSVCSGERGAWRSPDPAIEPGNGAMRVPRSDEPRKPSRAMTATTRSRAASRGSRADLACEGDSSSACDRIRHTVDADSGHRPEARLDVGGVPGRCAAARGATRGEGARAARPRGAARGGGARASGFAARARARGGADGRRARLGAARVRAVGELRGRVGGDLGARAARPGRGGRRVAGAAYARRRVSRRRDRVDPATPAVPRGNHGGSSALARVGEVAHRSRARS